jgi:hypothetical protein
MNPHHENDTTQNDIARAGNLIIGPWLDKVAEDLDAAGPIDLQKISKTILKYRQELLGSVAHALLEPILETFSKQEVTCCPGCNKHIRKKRDDNRTVSTLLGSTTISRPYFYCSDCKFGFHPADEALKLTEEFHQADIQEKLAKLTGKMTFEDAAETFTELTGIKVGNHLAHKNLERLSDSSSIEIVLPTKEEISEKIAVVTKELDEKPIMVVAVDGAFAPTRPPGKRNKKRGPGAWKEVKGFRIYLQGKSDRIVQLMSWHQIQNADELGSDLKFAAQLIPQDRVKIALLGDGAAWLWTRMKECFPDGKQILDYYHCSERVHQAAVAQFGQNSKAKEWAELAMVKLDLALVNTVVLDLKELSPRSPDANFEIQKLVTYLQNQKEKIGYKKAKGEGYPIGSGGIESSNKTICHKRLKLSGAWWLVECGNNMLRVRCALINKTYEKVIEKYLSKKLVPKVTKRQVFDI